MKMKIFIGLLLVVFLMAGCGPSLIIRPDKTIEVKGYHSVIQKDNSVSFIAKPWWSFNFTDSIVKIFESLTKNIVPVINPAPNPVNPPVTPTPVDPPAPAPPPTPVTPPPTIFSLALFDLSTAWKDMQQAGFPCREGVCLYALGQVARGYPIPGQSEELILIDTYYGQIKTWYEGKVNGGRAQLTANPSLTLTVCTNDAKDRFGFRLCPPTLDLFQDFGGRAVLGIITPESSY